MRLSTTAEYALRAMVWLASHPDEPLTSTQIAEETQIPPGYLSKVLTALARNGLVIPRRGRGGGFTLARSPKTITALDVIDAVDPLTPIEQCPLGYSAHGSNLCLLHSRMNDALSMVRKVYQDTTIQDLLGSKPDCVKICRGRQHSLAT